MLRSDGQEVEKDLFLKKILIQARMKLKLVTRYISLLFYCEKIYIAYFLIFNML